MADYGLNSDGRCCRYPCVLNFLRQLAPDAEVEVEELIRSFCESMPDELQSTAEGDEECGEFWDALVSDIQLDLPQQGWRQKPGRRSRSDLLNTGALQSD